MKKLDPKEFKRYLEVACASEKPSNWDIDPSVATVFAETGAMKTFLNQNLVAMLMLGAESAFCSVWLTAFQMGREFEFNRKEVSELKKMAKL